MVLCSPYFKPIHKFTKTIFERIGYYLCDNFASSIRSWSTPLHGHLVLVCTLPLVTEDLSSVLVTALTL